MNFRCSRYYLLKFKNYLMSSAKFSWNYWISKTGKYKKKKNVLIHLVKIFEKHLKLIQLGFDYILNPPNRGYCYAV